MDKIDPLEAEWFKNKSNYPLKKLKFLLKIVKVKSNLKKPIVLSVTNSGIRVKDTDSGKGQQSLDYSKYQDVSEGDFVMNHMDLLTGFVDISKYKGVTSPDYRVFKIINYNELLPKYLLKMFQVCYRLKIFYGYGQGVSLYGRWRFVDEFFLDFKIPVPKINDQKKIIKEIENFEKKFEPVYENLKKRIEINKIYLESFINDTFKRNINNKTENIKLKFLSKVKNGNSLNPKEKEKYSKAKDKSRSFISTADVNIKNFTIDYDGKFKIPDEEKKFRIAKKNSILFCLEGGSYGKKIGMLNRDVFFGNKLINIEAIYKIENIFLYYYMQSTNFKNDFYSRRVGLISGVSQDDLLNIKIPVMEKNIQVKLTKELDNFLTNYKKKTTLLNEYYEKIIEYYWQLIFEKVTLGK